MRKRRGFILPFKVRSGNEKSRSLNREGYFMFKVGSIQRDKGGREARSRYGEQALSDYEQIESE